MIFLLFIFLGVKAATCVRENGSNECWHFTGFNHNLVVNTLGMLNIFVESDVFKRYIANCRNQEY